MHMHMHMHMLAYVIILICYTVNTVSRGIMVVIHYWKLHLRVHEQSTNLTSKYQNLVFACRRRSTVVTSQFQIRKCRPWRQWRNERSLSVLVGLCAHGQVNNVMAWCRQATSHDLSQCCPGCMSSHGVTKPWCVNNKTSCLSFACINIWNDSRKTLEKQKWYVDTYDPIIANLNLNLNLNFWIQWPKTSHDRQVGLCVY